MAGERWRTSPPVALPDRMAIRQELEDIRDRFRRLILDVPYGDWTARTNRGGWRVRDVAAHIVTYPAVAIPRGVDTARRVRRWGGFPRFITHPFLTHWMNGWAARKETQAALLRRNDEAHDNVISLLASIRDDEWEKATYALGRRMTVYELFRVHAAHYPDHAQEIREALSWAAGRKRSGNRCFQCQDEGTTGGRGEWRNCRRCRILVCESCDDKYKSPLCPNCGFKWPKVSRGDSSV